MIELTSMKGPEAAPTERWEIWVRIPSPLLKRIWTRIWTNCPDSKFRYKNLDNNYSKKIGGLKLRLQVKVILPMAVY